MAQRRMFSKNVARTDQFLDMPPSTQNLYFHLGLEADDDGFVSPKMIMRMLGSTQDDYSVLVAKGFIIPFQSGVIVIRHWRVNNELKSDRYKPSIQNERKLLLIDEKNIYQHEEEYDPNGTKEDIEQLKRLPINTNVSKMDTKCFQDVSVGKVSIGKYSKGKYSDIDTLTDELLKEIANKESISLDDVVKTKKRLSNYCLSKGKIYKDYRAALENFISSAIEEGKIRKISSHKGGIHA